MKIAPKQRLFRYPGPEEANGLGLPFARLFREVNRQVTYSLRILEASTRAEFTEFCKYLMIIDK
jgi:hypothetical protein